MLEKFVRINGVYVHTASDAPNSLFLQRKYLLMVLWIVNNKNIIKFFIIKWMQIKDTSQQAFLIIYLICIFIYCNLFTFHLVDLGELLIWKVDPHKKVWAPLT